MTLALTLNALTFSDGTIVKLPRRGVVALVGPNNVGKTAALREVLQFLENRVAGVVTRNVDYSLVGSVDDALDWLGQNCHEFEKHGEKAYGRGSRTLHLSFQRRHLEACLSGAATAPQEPLGAFAAMLCVMLTAEERLDAARSSPAHDVGREPATTPLQELLSNEDIETQLRSHVRRAFGAEFVISRFPSKVINVHWGNAPATGPERDRASLAYRQSLEALPLLDTQGDGIRSFLGTLFHLRLAGEFVVLIDEPEAFLHPPQARQLGLLVGELASARQVFIATHSSDFLHGLLDSKAAELSIIHLRRSGSINHALALHGGDLLKTWADPMLRYGNILDGLFHDSVVLCESETDCRFYQAAFDHLWSRITTPARPQPTVLFTAVGGKTAFPRALGALRSLGIPARVVADFDILRDLDLLARICAPLQLDWESVRQPCKTVQEAVRKCGRAAPTIAQLRMDLENALPQDSMQVLNPETSKALAGVVRLPDPWALFKAHGRSQSPRGAEFESLDSLIATLAAGSLFVVPGGELESWVPAVGRKGMDWLKEVFRRVEEGENLYTSELLQFVGAVAGQPGQRDV